MNQYSDFNSFSNPLAIDPWTCHLNQTSWSPFSTPLVSPLIDESPNSTSFQFSQDSSMITPRTSPTSSIQTPSPQYRQLPSNYLNKNLSDIKI
jgi:hypothetical protein